MLPPPMLKRVVSSLSIAGVAGVVSRGMGISLEELEDKAKELRERTQIGKENSSVLEKLQASLFTAAANSVDQCLHLRKTIDQMYYEKEASLPEMLPQLDRARCFTLVLDLEETLVFSDYDPERGWKTFKRPGVDAFLKRLGLIYEVVVYTAQSKEYADSVVEVLNSTSEVNGIQYTLSRNNTVYNEKRRYRDLSKLNRKPDRIIYVTAHKDYTCQPENCVPVKAWKLEADDKALIEILPFLEYIGMQKPEDVRRTLQTYKDQDIPSEFNRRIRGTDSMWRRWRIRRENGGSSRPK